FNHPTSRRVLSSQDVTFDESVPYYRLFPYRTPSLPHPRSSWYQVPPSSPPPPQGPAPSAWGWESRGAEPGGAEPGCESGGAGPGGAEPGGAVSGGTEPGGAEPGGAEPGGAEPGGAVPGGASSHAGSRSLHRSCVSGLPGAGGVPLVLVVLRLRRALLPHATWRCSSCGCWSCWSEGSPGAGPAGDVGAEPAVGGPTDVLCLLLMEVLELLVVLRWTVLLEWVLRPELLFCSFCFWRRRACLGPYFVPLLEQVLGLAPPPPPLEGPQPVRSQPQLEPASPLPAPSPYAGPTGGLTERPDPESDSLRAASPTVTRLLATAVTDPSFESSAASALVTELVDFAARCRLDYAARLVAESESACPPSVGEGPYSSQLAGQLMDAEMASWKSTGTYVDAVPPPGANIVSGMWIFRVKRPPGLAACLQGALRGSWLQSAAGS
ncbi:unnamed protein product, partial [Closterium sp. NIES-65]